MKVKKMENFQNKRGLKGCKWSSLNVPGTENPLSHPLLEFSFQLRPASSLWKLMKGCVKQFASYRKFDHHVIEILKNKIWEDTEKVRKWQGEGEAPYDQGHDRGRGVQVVIFVINFQLRLQVFKPSTELFFSDFREWESSESREKTPQHGVFTKSTNGIYFLVA